VVPGVSTATRAGCGRCRDSRDVWVSSGRHGFGTFATGPSERRRERHRSSSVRGPDPRVAVMTAGFWSYGNQNPAVDREWTVLVLWGRKVSSDGWGAWRRRDGLGLFPTLRHGPLTARAIRGVFVAKPAPLATPPHTRPSRWRPQPARAATEMAASLSPPGASPPTPDERPVLAAPHQESPPENRVEG
jgi:hypothetical protein